MFAGYYSVASGILTHQREMDVIGNNLVNIQTPEIGRASCRERVSSPV